MDILTAAQSLINDDNSNSPTTKSTNSVLVSLRSESFEYGFKELLKNHKIQRATKNLMNQIDELERERIVQVKKSRK